MNKQATFGTAISLVIVGLCFSIAGATNASAGQVAKVREVVIAAPLTALGLSSNLLVSTNPNLDCTESGEVSGPFPGWSSDPAAQVTSVNIGKSNYGVYWCPATAPSGRGVITYTVTAPSGDVSCVTTATFCEMSGISSQIKLSIMATDETGSYPSASTAIQNNGAIQPCQTGVNTCNSTQANLTFGTYGNDSVAGLQDCTFAAVANWERIVLGVTPNSNQIESEFAKANAQNSGFTNDQVFSYWRNNGIGQTYLKTAVELSADPMSLINAINNPGIKAPIAELHFVKGQNFAGFQIQNGSYHWVVVDGYTTTGPLVVSWGQSVQMTWQQWNLEVAAMWGISVSR